MHTLHGLFDLKETCSEADFKPAFEAFAAHLSALGYLQSWRFMRRSPHDGYDARPPDQQLYICLDFIDRNTAQDCWDYVEKNQPPLRELHLNVNSKVQNAVFFLSEDVPSDDAASV